jgi:DNA-binding transcriptional LysR family regulator
MTRENRPLPHLDPRLLESVLAVAESGHFSHAAERLGLCPSTVSQHVARLEAALGVRLFRRDTHSVGLTPDGERLLPHARAILTAHERAVRSFAERRSRGRLRFGASEDLVHHWLSPVLAEFVATHPEIDLELTVALSATLVTALDEGRLDLVCCKRFPGQAAARRLWRDEVVWASGRAEERADRDPLPLILYPPPSMTREMALAALEREGRRFRISCTSSTLSGLLAASRAGLGLVAFARRLLPEGLRESQILPPLGVVDFVLLEAPLRADTALPVRALSRAIAERARHDFGPPPGDSLLLSLFDP